MRQVLYSGYAGLINPTIHEQREGYWRGLALCSRRISRYCLSTYSISRFPRVTSDRWNVTTSRSFDKIHWANTSPKGLRKPRARGRVMIGRLLRVYYPIYFHSIYSNHISFSLPSSVNIYFISSDICY